MDPDPYPDPDNFNGFRFSELRSSGDPNTERLLRAAGNPKSWYLGMGVMPARDDTLRTMRSR